MTPEQWSLIGKLYEGALEKSATERASFLSHACGGDQLLRSEVESLLAAEEKAGEFLEPNSADSASQPVTMGLPSLAAKKLNQYELLSRLGSGGMGEVYRALDTRLKREVAIKVLRNSPVEDLHSLRRFEREAQAASSLNCSGIVTVYEIGETEGFRFLVMELVPGQTLRQVVDIRPPLDNVVRICALVAQALEVAHASNIVHRDIKPENVMLRPDGYVKVLDFGLARSFSEAAAVKVATADGASGDGSAAITQPGILIGTLRYMSPEQAEGKGVTGASDIFSLGLVLYELVTGRHPFRRETQFGTLDAIVSQAALPPSQINPETPAILEELILRMLDKHPALRPSAGDVERALNQIGAVSNSLSPQPSIRNLGRSVGRERELAELNALLDLASSQGRLCCVSGEPGIGKTTFVETFLAPLTTGGRNCLVARGRCSERLAGTDAYSPVLEALDALQHQSDTVAGTLRCLAPDWYSQVALKLPADPPSQRPRVERAYSQERMKRELGSFLHEISRRQTVILFLEDMHWADFSTVDLLAFITDRMASFRLLVIVTFRPSDLLLAKHPFLKLKQEMQARGTAHEIRLPFLSRTEVQHYIALEFPQHGLPPEMADIIHAKTEGNPLFISALLRYFRDREIITRESGRWLLARPLPDLDRELPESMRAMIERRIGQLDEDDHRLLVTASVQGNEFDSAVLSRTLARNDVVVEERLEVLERVHQLTVLVNEREFPNRTLSLRYRFTHVVYQNAVYATLQPARRALLSNAVAEALLTLHADQSSTIASDLARLFEAGRNFTRAAKFYLVASKNATRIFAANEAAALARQGLTAIASAPQAPEQQEIEYALQLVLGNALMVILGYGAPEVVEIYERALEACRKAGDPTQSLPVLYGLWVSNLVHANIERALEVGKDFLDLSQRIESPAMVVGERMVGCPHFYLGHLAEARLYLERAVSRYDPARHRSLAWLYGQEPGMTARSYLSWTMWLLGYPNQAAEHHQESLKLTRDVEHALSRGHGLFFAAIHDYLRQDWTEFRELTGELVRVGQEWKLPFWLSAGRVLAGLITTKDGNEANGLAEMRDGIRASPNNKLCLTILHRLLAEGYAQAGQAAEALAAIEIPLTLIQHTHESFFEPELHRFRGDLLLQQAASNANAAAEQCYWRALDLARQQSAKSWELRSATSLGRLWAQQGKSRKVSELLTPLCAWFTEGHDSADIKDAKTLLAEQRRE